MAAAGSAHSYHFYCPHAQQQNSTISCVWETRPSGCLRISCSFHHSKPRYINGLFLPPSNNTPLQQAVQEGTLHPAQGRESPRNQHHFLPIHPPVIINLNDDDDEEDDEEEENCEQYVSNWVPKTAADIEEERAIKEICSKSGEYYRTQQPCDHQPAQSVSSPGEKEGLPLEAPEQDLQKGIHVSDPKVKPIDQQWGARTKNGAASSEPRRPAYVIYRSVTVTQDPKCNGSTETKQTELGENHHCKEVKEKKWISKEKRNSPRTATGKGILRKQLLPSS
ncbi:uncharacterized protein C12orf50 homolog [Apus apus]|uniref:uncharacterized protein C12orf50 homolog n=1 Tax=Apus apus TaxID=8895 RepID=UPI0021F8CC97|nr:uncharacterized protein C12orf50 homolog [Apus apus]